MEPFTTKDLYVRYLDGRATLEEIRRAVSDTAARYQESTPATDVPEPVAREPGVAAGAR